MKEALGPQKEALGPIKEALVPLKKGMCAVLSHRRAFFTMWRNFCLANNLCASEPGSQVPTLSDTLLQTVVQSPDKSVSRCDTGEEEQGSS